MRFCFMTTRALKKAMPLIKQRGEQIFYTLDYRGLSNQLLIARIQSPPAADSRRCASSSGAGGGRRVRQASGGGWGYGRANRRNATLAARPIRAKPAITLKTCWWPTTPGEASSSAPINGGMNTSGV